MNKTCKGLFGPSHTFGKWIRLPNRSKTRGDGSIVSAYMMQERVCDVCGFIQLNRQKIIDIYE